MGHFNCLLMHKAIEIVLKMISFTQKNECMNSVNEWWKERLSWIKKCLGIPAATVDGTLDSWVPISVRTDNRYVSVSADISVYRPIIGFADMSKPLSVSVIGIGRYRMPYRQPYRYTSRDQIYEEMLHCFTLFCKM